MSALLMLVGQLKGAHAERREQRFERRVQRYIRLHQEEQRREALKA